MCRTLRNFLQRFSATKYRSDAKAKIKKSIENASGPLQELQKYMGMNSLQLVVYDVEKTIGALEKALKDAVEILGLGSKKDQVTKAYNEAWKFVSHARRFIEEHVDPNKEIIDPKVLQIKESIENASDPLEKLRDYKDMGLVSLALCDIEKLINNFEEALEPIRTLGCDKQKQATEAYDEAWNLVSHAKKFLKRMAIQACRLRRALRMLLLF